MTLNWLTYFPSPARGVWHLGPVPIRAYALCIIIGIVIALLIGDRRWRARGGEPGVIYDIALWAVPFGLIGGRLYHLMTDWRTYFGEGGAGWEATPRIWDGGLGIWGAVALGGIGAWIGCRRRGIPLPAFGDAVAPGIVLAQAIGRLGNYFNQELYGRETTLPWGLEIFWREDAAGVRDPHLLDGVSTGELYKIAQPTFLYELLWNLAVFVVLIYADRRFRMGHGRLFALYVAGYCVGRFGIELLRDDAATHIAGIRVNSFTSTFVFIGAVVYILLATKGREDPDVIRRGWEPGDVDDQVAADEPEPAPEEELVAVGAANGVGSVVRVPKRLTGEDETEPDEVGADAGTELEDAENAELDAETDQDEADADEAESDEPVADAGDEDAGGVEDEAVEDSGGTGDEPAEDDEPAEAEEERAEVDEGGEEAAEVPESAPQSDDQAEEPDTDDPDDTEDPDDAEDPEDAEDSEAAPESDDVPEAEADAVAAADEDDEDDESEDSDQR
ncbi:MAG: prolipoprotein diacylglyceryl transferase [Actinomycetota bacterium]|nr:prolipoprotein diacylglyceryl transferase [Actinomycetota bacterium]